jgi:uronate dehydrogenase
MDDLAQTTWLLTGANGTIGRRLRPYLRGRVARLVVADLEAPADPVENETAAAFDLTDPSTIAPLLSGCDGVIHLAGIPDEAPYTDLLRINALGTHHLLEAMRVAGVPHLVYASSNRATGFHSTNDILDDEATIRPDGLYGASKAAAEALVRMYSDKFGLRVCTLRIGSFEEEPTTAREAATWLSPADAMRAFEAAMTTRVPYSTGYAVSATRHRFWSLEPGRRIGYHPVDDASTILGDDVRPPADVPQAGDMASAEFTLRFL